MTAIQLDYQKQFEVYDQLGHKNSSGKYWNKIEDLIYKNPKNFSELAVNKMFKLLGFDKEPPRFSEFISRYLLLLKESSIPKSDWLLPAVVLSRGGGPKPLEIKLITPGIDEWPKESGWEINSNLFFNLPTEFVLTGISQGRYPLFKFSAHDLHHFISFLIDPAYMTGIRKQFQTVKTSEINEQLEYRMALILESFAYLKPAQFEQAKQLLLVPQVLNKTNSAEVPFSEFKKVYDQMSIDTLLKQAKTMSEKLMSFLEVNGGGTLNQREMTYYRNLFSENLNLFYTLIAKKRHFQNLFEFTLVDNPYYSSEMLVQLLQMYTDHENLLSRVQNDQSSYEPHLSSQFAGHLTDQKAAKQWIEQMLRVQLARTEYLFWTMANTMTPERFFSNLLRQPGFFDPDFIELIKYGFGEESNLYLSLTN